MLVEVLKAKQYDTLLYGTVQTVDETLKRTKVLLTNRAYCQASYQDASLELLAGDIVLLGRTKGGAYFVIQKTSNEIPTEADILTV